MPISQAEAERRIRQLEEELVKVKASGANPSELSEIRKELRAYAARVDAYHKEVRSLPVVTAEEAGQIYAAEREEETLYPCPNCSYSLKGNENRCPGCGDPINWVEG